MNRITFMYLTGILFSMNAAAKSVADTLTIEKSYNIEDVVVTGTRTLTDIRHLPMTVSVFDRTDLERFQQPSILPTLSSQVPGLFITSRGMMGYGVSNGAAGGISLRGIAGGSGRLMVLIDGHPQYNGIFGHPISDSYQTMMAERVEVLRGPASMLYGSNAMGGVINIVTRGMNVDGNSTEFNFGAGSYGTVQSDVSHSLRKKKFSMNVSGQYNRSDNHRPNMEFEQYGGHIRLGYDLSLHYKIFANANVTHFDASYPGSIDAPIFEADQWITRGEVSGGVQYNYEHSDGTLTAFSNFGRHKINDGYEMGKSPQTRLFRSKDALTGVSWFQSVNLFKGNRLTMGFDYQHIYGNAYYTSRETDEVLETQNKQSGKAYINEVAGYVDMCQEFNQWLTVDGGIRWDHHSVSGGEWIPQIGLVVRPSNSSDIKLSVSKGFRNPTMREMYLYPPSNEDLEQERLFSYELSWKQHLLQNRLNYGVNVFYINGDNMIQTVNRKNVNTGNLENWGAEFELAYKLTPHFRLTTNHSCLHMVHPILAAPEYMGYLGMEYAVKKWSLNVGIQQICGLYTQIDEIEKETFTLLNASISYRLCKNIGLWVRGENLLAQCYQINLGYPMPKATVMCGVRIRF